MIRRPASRSHNTTIHPQSQDRGTRPWCSMHKSEGTTWIGSSLDGGRNMNIIFASTLQKMLIPRSVWRKLSTERHGVVLGEAATSLGVIELKVIFGNRRNFAK